MVYALAQLAYDKGWPDMAILLLLGFDRYARSGELFSARKAEFTWNASRTKAVWSLPLTKSGQRVGAQESLVVSDPWLVGALANYLHPLQPGDFLRTVSPGLMRTRLKALFSELGFPEGFQWYSLRRGGATHAFRVSNDLSAVCLTGRWNCLKTARIYLTDALAQLTEIHLDPLLKRKLLSLARRARPRYNFDL
eukprot:Skav209853  [mRNA]  locus=scaffold1684:57346:57927:+ [translate_table: standard]